MGESAEARAYQREVSEMLGGKMSNQDEDEVEDELEGLEREVNGVRGSEVLALPEAPRTELRESESLKVQAERRKVRARERAREQISSPAEEPMLA